MPLYNISNSLQTSGIDCLPHAIHLERLLSIHHVLLLLSALLLLLLTHLLLEPSFLEILKVLPSRIVLLSMRELTGRLTEIFSIEFNAAGDAIAFLSGGQHSVKTFLSSLH